MLGGSSTLFDVLAIVIAFSAVMLLLSVMVTALSQATQAALRLRARNLQSGLAGVVEQELKTTKSASRNLAATLLNSPEIAVLKRRKDPTSLMGRIMGPHVSWCEPEDLRRVLKAQGAPQLHAIDSAVERFGRLEGPNGPLIKRFAYWMRVVTVSWAVIVAFAFQVSSPDLLRKLSTDPGVSGEIRSVGQDFGEIAREQIRGLYHAFHREAPRLP